MIKSFEISKFRKFEAIKFKDLGRINIFLGNNNVGKTTILEAIYAYTCGGNVGALIQGSILRNKRGVGDSYEFAEKLLSAFHDQNQVPFRFSLSATTADGRVSTYEHSLLPGNIFAELNPGLARAIDEAEFDEQAESLGGSMTQSIFASRIRNSIVIGEWVVAHEGHARKVKLNAPFHAPAYRPMDKVRMIDILDHRDQQEAVRMYSILQREDLLDSFVAELSKTFPNIVGIDSFPYPNGKGVQIRFKTKDRGWLPYYSFGDGVQRWYNILAGMMVYRGGVHCIEEADATLHAKAHKGFALNLVEYAEKFGNQLFLSSHNLEFMDNMLRAVYEDQDISADQDPIRVITLRGDDETGNVKVRTLTGRDAYESREKFHLELR